MIFKHMATGGLELTNLRSREGHPNLLSHRVHLGRPLQYLNMYKETTYNLLTCNMYNKMF